MIVQTVVIVSKWLTRRALVRIPAVWILLIVQQFPIVAMDQRFSEQTKCQL